MKFTIGMFFSSRRFFSPRIFRRRIFRLDGRTLARIGHNSQKISQQRLNQLLYDVKSTFIFMSSSKSFLIEDILTVILNDNRAHDRATKQKTKTLIMVIYGFRKLLGCSIEGPTLLSIYPKVTHQ